MNQLERAQKLSTVLNLLYVEALQVLHARPEWQQEDQNTRNFVSTCIAKYAKSVPLPPERINALWDRLKLLVVNDVATDLMEELMKSNVRGDTG